MYLDELFEEKDLMHLPRKYVWMNNFHTDIYHRNVFLYRVVMLVIILRLITKYLHIDIMIRIRIYNASIYYLFL